MTLYTAKGVPYPDGTDPLSSGDDAIHALADWVDEQPGISALTTSLRNALSGDALWGDRIIWNVTTGRFERYDLDATTWVPTHVDPSTGVDADITTASPGDTALAGGSGRVADAAHRHTVPGWGVAANLASQSIGATASAGASGKFADAAHRHAMPVPAWVAFAPFPAPFASEKTVRPDAYPAGYRLWPSGMVELRGAWNIDADVIGNDTALDNLPAGARPAKIVRMAAACSIGSNVGVYRLDVRPNGDIAVQAMPAGTTTVCYDGCYFWTS